MKKKKMTLAITLIVVVLLGILIWGLIGSSEAAKIGTTCDFGVGKEVGGEPGSALCWKWHRNEIGQLGDNLAELFD
jgi:hypothetical protein